VYDVARPSNHSTTSTVTIVVSTVVSFPFRNHRSDGSRRDLFR
jgi:hypothetical protein